MREAIKDVEIMKKEMDKHSSDIISLKEIKEDKKEI